jgi:hypothetical protein
LLKAAGKSFSLTVAGFGTAGSVKVDVTDWASARATETDTATASSQQAGLPRSNRNADIRVTMLVLTLAAQAAVGPTMPSKPPAKYPHFPRGQATRKISLRAQITFWYFGRVGALHRADTAAMS